MDNVVALMILSLDSLSCGVYMCVCVCVCEYSMFAWYVVCIRLNVVDVSYDSYLQV